MQQRVIVAHGEEGSGLDQSNANCDQAGGDQALGLDDLDVLENLLSFYVRSVNYALSTDLDARLDGLEVARGTGKITALLLIDSHPGIRPSAIAKVTLRDRPAMTRTIAPMVAAGLIEQRVSQRERRATELFVTPRGHDVAEQVRAIAREQSNDFFSVLASEDREHLLRILRQLYQTIRVQQ